ncbi:NAD(P)H-binding protein [Methylophaga lonarensis]|uniref:NAD(P)H-binding protein n=1 Tax=Methylophaga lonarensis TaxID=999151 RepID=UPI003D2AE509
MNDIAIVLGATGAVGKQLVRQLSVRADISRVIVISRRDLVLSDEFAGADIAKLDLKVVDFQQLEQQVRSLIPADSLAFIALGTTQKQAGSQAAFRQIDHELAVAFARACKSAAVARLGVITAVGANVNSLSFYSRVKGEVERDIQALDLPSVFFARPSLLLGRPDDGRFAEKLAYVVFRPLTPWLPKAIRPVSVQCVAAAMLNVAYDADIDSAAFILTNAQIHQRCS